MPASPPPDPARHRQARRREPGDGVAGAERRRQRAGAHPAGDARAGAEDHPRDRLRARSDRPPHGQGLEPHPRRLHLRAGLSERAGRLLPALPVRHRGRGAGARLRPAAADRRRPGRAAQDLRRGKPAAHRRRLHRARARPSTAANSRGWWPATIPSSPSAGARMPAARCPSSAATTRPPPARWCGRRASWATGGWPISGPIGPAESTADRWRGFTAALGDELRARAAPARARRPTTTTLLDALLASGATVAFFVELADAVRARARGARARAAPAGRSLDHRAGLAHPRRRQRHALHLLRASRARRWAGRPPRCWCAASRAARRRRCSRCCCPASRSAATPSAPRSRTEPDRSERHEHARTEDGHPGRRRRPRRRGRGAGRAGGRPHAW